MLENTATLTTKEVSVVTPDGLSLSVLYIEGPVKENAVILVHQLGGRKEDWVDFGNSLAEEGLGVAAIDLRGHGASQGNIASFNESDFQLMVEDIRTLKQVLVSSGYKQISYVGASLGANAVLLASQPEEKVVLLSPGLSYRGLDVREKMLNFQGLGMIVASKEDEYSAQSGETMKHICQNRCQYILLENANHGLRMLERNETIKGKIVEFLKN